MADVFLSYARAERSWALAVRDALVLLNVSVFFDVDGIDGGSVFPDVLDREVKSARVVLGLWSPYALTRPWVRTECDIGRARGVLIPAAVAPLDTMQIPAAFWNLQYVDLTHFGGRIDDPGFAQLVRSIGRMLGRRDLADYRREVEPEPRRPPVPQPPAPRPARTWQSLLIVGALIAALAGVVAYVGEIRPAASEVEPVVPDDNSATESPILDMSPPAGPLPVGVVEREQAVAGLQNVLNDSGFEAGKADGVPGVSTRRAAAEAASWFQLNAPDLDAASAKEIEEFAASIRGFSTQVYGFGLPATPASPPSACPVETVSIDFVGDTASISDEGLRRLRVLYDYSRNPPCLIYAMTISATDDNSQSVGNVSAHVMATRRAGAVRARLVSLGLFPEWIVWSAGAPGMDRVAKVSVFYSGPRLR